MSKRIKMKYKYLYFTIAVRYRTYIVLAKSIDTRNRIYLVGNHTENNCSRERTEFSTGHAPSDAYDLSQKAFIPSKHQSLACNRDNAMKKHPTVERPIMVAKISISKLAFPDFFT